MLDPWGIRFHAVIVFDLGKNLLSKSILGRCVRTQNIIGNLIISKNLKYLKGWPRRKHDIEQMDRPEYSHIASISSQKFQLGHQIWQ